MDLQALGFDDWFAARAGDAPRDGESVARVMAVDRGVFVVRDDQGEIGAELAGRFRFAVESSLDMPCVGDWVRVERESPERAIIHTVFPRKTFLRRKRPGKTVEFQMIATNLDVVFIFLSCHYDFNIRRLDRYLVAANEGHITPVIILSKTDLVSDDEREGMIRQIRDGGISTLLLPVSSATGAGVEAVRDLLQPGKTFGLLGSSGVGKTTLINRLIGEDVFRTLAVSSSGEGMHATTRRQLIPLDSGALLLDTPGMRELGLLGSSSGLDDNFAIIRELSTDCRFSNCSHSQEPGCAVLLAIDTGDLSREQYDSYIKLSKENDYHNLSYVQKRKKGKDFGRFIKSAKKQGEK